MNSLVVGHALDPATDIGPVADSNHLQSNLSYLEVARAEGTDQILGGEVLELATPGHYLRPALVTGTTNDQTTNRAEVFGPIASVIAVDDYEEALHVANDTPFGLSAGICTTSLRLAEHFKSHAEAGMVMINLPTAGVDPYVPFGGRKRFSYGDRELGASAREFYTITKTAYTYP